MKEWRARRARKEAMRASPMVSERARKHGAMRAEVARTHNKWAALLEKLGSRTTRVRAAMCILRRQLDVMTVRLWKNLIPQFSFHRLMRRQLNINKALRSTRVP